MGAEFFSNYKERKSSHQLSYSAQPYQPVNFV